LNHWLRRRILEPLLKLLSSGLAPSRLALCVAVGIVIGTIPILGVSTILCTLVALLFRLNLPAIQLAQWANGCWALRHNPCRSKRQRH
jgi:uncharacterized protein (DUF2062 family)